MTPVKLGGDAAPRALVRIPAKPRAALILWMVIPCATAAVGLLNPALATDGGTFDRPRAASSQPSTGRTAKESAIRSIPFEKLDDTQRAKISALLSESHVFRRLPVHVGPCDPDLYLFLVRHPDVVVGIWEELGISQLKMKQIGPDKYQTHESSGTVGTSEFLYQDPNLHLIWIEGMFNGPLLTKPVRGTSLLILRTGYIREPGGRHYITSRLDTFTHIDNVGIEFITKTLQPSMGKVVDNNFTQTSAFVAGLSRTAEVNPRGVRRLAGKLHRVHPEIRQELGRLAYKVADKSNRHGKERLAAKPVVKRALE